MNSIRVSVCMATYNGRKYIKEQLESILSQISEFDEVIISDDLFKLLDHKLVMVEGVYNLMNILKERIDYIVLIVSPKIRNGINALNEINIDFEIVHENYIGEEKIMFLKRKV